MNLIKKKIIKFITLTLILTFISIFIYSTDLTNDSFSNLQVNWGVSLEGIQVGGLNKIQLNKIITRLAQKKKIKAENSFIFKEKIWPEIIGKKVDIKDSIERTLTAEPGQKIKLTYTEIYPIITKRVLINKEVTYLNSKKVKLLAHFTTYINNSSQDRKNNIILALQEIDNYLLKPQEEFSFNKVVKYTSKEKGYLNAPIIDSGRIFQKTGGGICQVSSTLYNAVKKATLKITELHHHSKKINYLPPKKDATVAPEEKDFRFINNTNRSIIILSDTINNYIAIYLFQVILH